MTSQLSKLKPYLLLLVILVLAYLPVSTLHFGMKNDAFSDNFPNKFFLTQALHSGFAPLWNPYLNFGFPIYSDPGFAFWNPITWFFGAVIGYNAYTLTVEVLLYIYLAGVTMYRLGRYLGFTITTAVTIASMYMCCGFFVGELQHINFLTSAAFLPFLIQRFLGLSKNPGYRNAGFAAIGYYMVFAGGHPAMPVATVYFLFTLSLSLLILHKETRQNLKMFLYYHSLSVVIFAILYSPAIYSYLAIISEYGRAVPVIAYDKKAVYTSFSLSPYISFLYPFATTKNPSFIINDLTARNYYFSLAGFALAITQLRNKSYVVRSLIICTAVMLILSSVGAVKTLLFSYLPFLKYIRTNSEFRVFSLLCLCLMAGYAFNDVELKEKETFAVFRKGMKTIAIITVCLFFYIAVKDFPHLLDLLNKDSKSGVQLLKGIIDAFTFNDVLLIAVILNLVFITMLLAAKNNVKRLSFIIILDLLVNSIIYLPFSGVGVVTLSEIQNIYDKSENKISIPPLTIIKNIDTLQTKTTGLVGSAAFYNKKIGITRLEDYPSYFSTTETYFNSKMPDVINRQPYLFLRSDINDSIHTAALNKALTVKYFSPQKIAVNVNIASTDTIVLLQNHFRFWKATVDGKMAPIDKSFITFMSVPLSKGAHSIVFYYHDNWLLLFVLTSIGTLILLVIFLYTSRQQRNILGREKKNE